MEALKQRDPGGRWLLAIALLLFCAGVLADPPWKRYGPTQHVQLEGEALHVAVSLWHSGRFADPYQTMPTGATAHVAPVYPFLQSVILRLFGDGPEGWLALRWLATISMSLEFALLPWFARLSGYGVWTGFLGSVLGLVTKPLREEQWEGHFAGLVGLLLTAAACWWSSRGRKPGQAMVVGLVAGFAILLHPVMALVYFAWVLYEARLFPSNALLLWIVPVVVCAPWAIRNEVSLGTFDIRDNLGTELNVSNNDCATFAFRDTYNSNCFGANHPNLNPQETLALRAMGESKYNQDRLQKALAWMVRHPRSEFALFAERFWFFWFPPDQNSWRGYPAQRTRTVLFYAMTAATVVGLFISWKRRVVAAPLLTLWIALFPLVYYLVLFEPRYRYPVLWITWLEAAYVIVWIGGRFVRSR